MYNANPTSYQVAYANFALHTDHAPPMTPPLTPPGSVEKAPTAILTNDQKRHTKRTRTAFTSSQLLDLENEFKRSMFLYPTRGSEIAQRLGLMEKHVKVWFQNRRMKSRKEIIPNQNKVTKTYQPHPRLVKRLKSFVQHPSENKSPNVVVTTANRISHPMATVSQKPLLPAVVHEKTTVERSHSLPVHKPMAPQLLTSPAHLPQHMNNIPRTFKPQLIVQMPATNRTPPQNIPQTLMPQLPIQKRTFIVPATNVVHHQHQTSMPPSATQMATTSKQFQRINAPVLTQQCQNAVHMPTNLNTYVMNNSYIHPATTDLSQQQQYYQQTQNIAQFQPQYQPQDQLHRQYTYNLQQQQLQKQQQIQYQQEYQLQYHQQQLQEHPSNQQQVWQQQAAEQQRYHQTQQPQPPQHIQQNPQEQVRLAQQQQPRLQRRYEQNPTEMLQQHPPQLQQHPPHLQQLLENLEPQLPAHRQLETPQQQLLPGQQQLEYQLQTEQQPTTSTLESELELLEDLLGNPAVFAESPSTSSQSPIVTLLNNFNSIGMDADLNEPTGSREVEQPQQQNNEYVQQEQVQEDAQTTWQLIQEILNENHSQPTKPMEHEVPEPSNQQQTPTVGTAEVLHQEFPILGLDFMNDSDDLMNISIGDLIADQGSPENDDFDFDDFSRIIDNSDAYPANANTQTSNTFNNAIIPAQHPPNTIATNLQPATTANNMNKTTQQDMGIVSSATNPEPPVPVVNISFDLGPNSACKDPIITFTF